MMHKLNIVGFVLILCMAPLAASAQTPPAIEGFWTYTFPPHDHVATALIEALPDDAVMLGDTGIVEFPQGEFGGLELKPEALANAMTWTPAEELEPRNMCTPPSIIYAMQGPFPMEIYPGDKLLIIKMEYFDMIRVVFMDGRDHPPADAPHSKAGHSIGHWDGDTLVVDTTHLSAATITNNGLSHGDNAHVVERFALSDDGQTLWATQVFDDPDTLKNKGARIMAWRYVPQEHVFPYECDPFTYQE